MLALTPPRMPLQVMHGSLTCAISCGWTFPGQKLGLVPADMRRAGRSTCTFNLHDRGSPYCVWVPWVIMCTFTDFSLHSSLSHLAHQGRVGQCLQELAI